MSRSILKTGMIMYVKGLTSSGLAEGLVIITQGPSAGHRGGTNRMEIIDLGQPSVQSEHLNS